MGLTRRRFLGGATTGALGLLLAACGAGGAGSNGAATAPASSAAASSVPAGSTTGGGAAGSKTKVRFWYGLGGQLGEAITGQVAKFNAAQGAVEVEGVFQQNYDTVQQKFQAALVGGDVPEIIQMEIHATPQFASSGALTPIEPFYAGDPAFNFADLVPATLLNQRWEGKLYAMPINRSTPLLYYNKKLFREAGLDPERPPRTWAEFREMGRQLTKGETLGFLPAADWWFFESVVWGNGGELLSKDLKTATFAQPGAAVLQGWADMVYRDKTARVLTGATAGEQRAQEYIQGRGAMLMSSTASLGQFIREVKDFEIGTAYMPHGEGFAHAVPTGGAAAAIPARVAPERQRAAWEFIKWWISPEQAAFWSQNTGYFPVRQSSIEILTKQGYYQERPQFKTTIDQLQYAREAPLTPHFPAIGREIVKAMEAILVNDTPALEALTQAQERAQAIVRQ
jgi:ABC-type glycerol-3-phosphate transport system substrate-binding protein